MHDLLKVEVDLIRSAELEKQCFWNEIELKSELNSAKVLHDKILSALSECEDVKKKVLSGMEK